jgi:hypothetical protein
MRISARNQIKGNRIVDIALCVAGDARTIAAIRPGKAVDIQPCSRRCVFSTPCPLTTGAAIWAKKATGAAARPLSS